MSSIYDGTKYLYAEQLKGKRVTLKIKRVTGGVEFCDTRGQKNKGFDIEFEQNNKAGEPIILGVTSVTVRRQIFMATGTDNPAEMVGKELTLYPVTSKKSVTGQAIRVAVPEQNA